MIKQITPEFLRSVIVNGAQFDYNDKTLYFNVFVNDRKQKIVQLLQLDSPNSSTSLVLVSIAKKPDTFYATWNIESLFGTGFYEMVAGEILSYLNQNTN
jgi:hypothetical protein